MSTIHKLRECTSLAEADQILSSVKAGPAVRKLVETGILLKANPDRAQREFGSSFINSAIQEVEDKINQASGTAHDNGVKSKGDHFVKEEELAGGNKSGTAGSEQSTDNTPPYPEEGKQSEDGSKDMEKMSDTENQMTEAFPGMPGQMPGMGQMMPGLEPSVANEMGQGMPQMPPMSTPQMMKQMQYTLEKYHRNIVAPMRKVIAQQREAITVLSTQVRETETRSGSMKLDIASVKRNAGARNAVQEISGNSWTGLSIVQDAPPKYGKTEQAKSDILAMNKALDSQSYYQ